MIATASLIVCDFEACHRSLVAERLAEEHGVEVVQLRP
jgi:hypothetical protein